MTDQFSAHFPQFVPTGPETDAPVSGLRDVILCATNPAEQTETGEYMDHLPVGALAIARVGGDGRGAMEVDLGRGVVLKRLSSEDADLVMNACAPRGHYFAPIRQFGQRYSLVLDLPADVWEGDRGLAWDPDGVLYDALTMSRLIRDNGFSLQYAARIVDYEDGEQCVVWNPSPGGKTAYRLRRDREWLDAGEADELAALLDALWSADLPPRVRRALWRAEWAGWSAFADAMLPTLVGGLEALLKTRRYELTAMFKVRAAALAVEAGIEGIDEDFCGYIYDGRSDWVHGSEVALFGDAASPQPTEADRRDVLADIAKVQDLLRATCRRAIEDQTFRETFAADASIDARWPA